jgi:hypothetical protein
MLKIAIVIGSTRPGRKGDAVAKWAYDIARQRSDAQTAHRTVIERMADAGAGPNTALAVVTELFRDWASPLADKAREVIYWYFSEVPKPGAKVGVSAAVKPAVRAREHT